MTPDGLPPPGRRYHARRAVAHVCVRDDSTSPAPQHGRDAPASAASPLVIATTLRETGITGVHTHLRQLIQFLEAKGTPATLVTSFSWGRPLIAPVFGARFLLQTLAVIEAMKAGLPILAPRTGGVPELFDDGAEGRFWPLDDQARAAALLMGLVDDEAERARAGRAAQDRFRRAFDAEVVAPRLLSFLFDGTAHAVNGADGVVSVGLSSAGGAAGG
jgi:hypothetical protein